MEFSVYLRFKGELPRFKSETPPFKGERIFLWAKSIGYGRNRRMAEKGFPNRMSKYIKRRSEYI